MDFNMQEEIFPIVDTEGNITGQASRKECHNGSKLLHPVIHLHIFNSKGELFLQKRSSTKDIQPNKWDSSVGGHIDLEETPEQAAHREASEEIGIQNITIYYIDKYIIETEIEKELTYCFFAQSNQQPTIDKDEVSDGRYWTLKEIKEHLNSGIFTPNFELDFNNFLYKGIESLLKQFK
jgi:isopentenyl-diphosphate delta-isomerase type 1